MYGARALILCLGWLGFAFPASAAEPGVLTAEERKRLQGVVDQARSSSCPCRMFRRVSLAVPPMIDAMAATCANPALKKAPEQLRAMIARYAEAARLYDDAHCDIPSYTLEDGRVCRETDERSGAAAKKHEQAFQRQLLEEGTRFLQTCARPGAPAPKPQACRPPEAPRAPQSGADGCKKFEKGMRDARSRLFFHDQLQSHRALALLAETLTGPACQAAMTDYAKQRDLDYKAFEADLARSLPCGSKR